MNQDVHSQLQAAGLILDKPLEYGRLVRCKVEGDRGQKASGWYVLHEFRLDNGTMVAVGRFGNWKAGTGEVGRRVHFDFGQINEEERARAVALNLAVRQQAEQERLERQQQAGERARRIWAKLPDSGVSAYLQRKRVKAYGLRFSRGNIVVPVRRTDGDLVGLQFISADGSKKFLTGTPKSGCFHLIGVEGQAGAPDLVAIAEGYATGATIHEATGWPVAVAFDAGNLKPVALGLRKAFPGAMIVVCADRDQDATPAWGCSACGWMVLRQLGDRPNPRYAEPAACPECGAVCLSGGPGEILARAAAVVAQPASISVPEFPEVAA